MQFLKSFILKISILVLFSFLVSCSKTVNFDTFLAEDQPFIVNIVIKTDRTMLGNKTSTEIHPETADYKELINWFRKNTTGWNETIASFEKQNMVVQNDFKLYYMGYYVAISYIDAQGKSHHLNKTVELGSLDFLFD